MLIMALEKVPMSLKGALSRWLLEPKSGIFLGNPSARVRDELWKRALKTMKGKGTVLQVWSDKSPQGFSYRQYGESNREFVDFEGLALIRVSPATRKLSGFYTEDA